MEALIYGVVAGVLAVLAGYFGRREIRKLHCEYRYEENDSDDSVDPS